MSNRMDSRCESYVRRVLQQCLVDRNLLITQADCFLCRHLMFLARGGQARVIPRHAGGSRDARARDPDAADGCATAMPRDTDHVSVQAKRKAAPV